MGEHYVRTANLALDVFCEPFAGESAAHHHGVVNELAYRLFVKSARDKTRLDKLDKKAIAVEVAKATQFISHFRQHGRKGPMKPGVKGTRDAIALALKMQRFFKSNAPQGLVLQPRF